MNSVHEQLPKTVTANSALSQNWVGCTVCTPRTQVARTLRSQCLGRGRMSRPPCLAQSTAQVVTSFPCRDLLEAIPCRDITLVLRHHLSCPASSQVATSFPGRDFISRSRPPGRPTYVATSSSCRDLNSQQARSRRQFHVATSWRLTYVATSISCRNITSAHNGHSRSQHRNPCRGLPHCRPCRDINFMSRHCFCSTKTDQVATSLPCRDLTCYHPRRDLKMMSRHQAASQGFQPCRHSSQIATSISWSRPHAQPNQVATSYRCRDLHRS